MNRKHAILLLIVYGMAIGISLSIAIKTANAETAQIYYSFNSTPTSSLFIGGHIHFPKAFADRIKVSGGVIEEEDEREWIIKVTDPQVRIDYLLLTNNSFETGTKTFQAKEYRKELYQPMKPDEIRQQVKITNNRLMAMQEQISAIASDIQELKSKPTSWDQFKAFLKESPFMKPVYLILAFLIFVSILGWLYGRV